MAGRWVLAGWFGAGLVGGCWVTPREVREKIAEGAGQNADDVDTAGDDDDEDGRADTADTGDPG